MEEKVLTGPETSSETGISNMLITAINGEWDTINLYNSIVETLRAEAEDTNNDYSDMINVINDILSEENKHIGQLQECLKKISPNTQDIEKGSEEGLMQLDESYFDDPYEDYDEGIGVGFKGYLDFDKHPIEALIDKETELTEQLLEEIIILTEMNPSYLSDDAKDFIVEKLSDDPYIIYDCVQDLDSYPDDFENYSSIIASGKLYFDGGFTIHTWTEADGDAEGEVSYDTAYEIDKDPDSYELHMNKNQPDIKFELVKKEDIKEAFNYSSNDYILTDLDEMRADSINNASDEEIDRQEKMFTYIQNQLGSANPSVLVTGTAYDPKWYKNDSNQIIKMSRYDLEKCNFVGLMPFIREEFNGRIFIYFDDEADAKSYVDTVDAINEENISWDEYYNNKKQEELSVAEKVEADIESHKITPKAIDSLSDVGLTIDDVVLLPNLSHELDGSYGNIMVQYYYSPEREQAYLIADY